MGEFKSTLLKSLASKRGWWGSKPALSTLEVGREKETFCCGIFDICLPSIFIYCLYIFLSTSCIMELRCLALVTRISKVEFQLLDIIISNKIGCTV